MSELAVLAQDATKTDSDRANYNSEFSALRSHIVKSFGQKFNDRLRQLGQDCWELVSVLDTNYTGGATRDVVAVFKRPLK
jgi:hypothetical protein